MSDDPRARRLDRACGMVSRACRGRATLRVGPPGGPATSVRVYAVEVQLGLVERHDAVDLRWEGYYATTAPARRGVTRVEIREIEDIVAGGGDLGRALLEKIEGYLMKPITR